MGSMTDNHSSKLPEKLRPLKACSHKSTIWKEDLVSCNPSSQSLRMPSRPSKRSLMSEEWERSEDLQAEHHLHIYMNMVIESMHPHAARVSQDRLMIHILNYI